MSDQSKLPPIISNQSESAQAEVAFNHKALSVIKKARKQVEEDAKLLANRIALLKQEEIKTIKKIEETRNKAMEIYRLKLKNEEKQQKRQKDKQKDKSQKSVQDMRLQKLEEKKKFLLSEDRPNKDDYTTKMQERIKFIRSEKQQYKQKKALNTQKSVLQAIERKNKIKEENQLGKQRILEFYNQKREKFRADYMVEMTKEEMIKNKKEHEISKMEKLEMDLISKLQSSQIQQKNAYQELQNALTLPAKEFERKYLIEGESEGLFDSPKKEENEVLNGVEGDGSREEEVHDGGEKEDTEKDNKTTKKE